MSQPYACHQCPTTFATKREQAHHLGYEHFEWYNWKCGECAVACDTEGGLVGHYSKADLEFLHDTTERPISSQISQMPPPHAAIISPSASKKRNRGQSLFSLSYSPHTSPAPRPRRPKRTLRRLRRRLALLLLGEFSDPYGLRGKFYREHFVKGGQSANQFLTAKKEIEREVIDLTSPVKESEWAS